MKSLQVKPNRAAVVTAIAAHVLAWAAFLWIAFWPYSYQGVSVNSDHPAYVDGLGYVDELGVPTGEEVVRLSASFIEVNGFGAVIYMLIPVILTALALLALLVWNGTRVRNTLISGGLATVLLAFCGLGYLSYGILYLPAALALITAAIIYGFRPGPGKEPQQQSGA